MSKSKPDLIEEEVGDSFAQLEQSHWNSDSAPHQPLAFKTFIYLILAMIFFALCGLSLVAASESYSSLQCMDSSLQWLLLLQGTGSRCIGSVHVTHGLSCCMVCGIFPDQGSNLCPLPWRADS